MLEGSALAAVRTPVAMTGRRGDNETRRRGDSALQLLTRSPCLPLSPLPLSPSSRPLPLDGPTRSGAGLRRDEPDRRFPPVAALRQRRSRGASRRRVDPAGRAANPQAGRVRASVRAIGRAKARRNSRAKSGGPGLLPPQGLAGRGRFLAQRRERFVGRSGFTPKAPRR